MPAILAPKSPQFEKRSKAKQSLRAAFVLMHYHTLSKMCEKHSSQDPLGQRHIYKLLDQYLKKREIKFFHDEKQELLINVKMKQRI